MKAMRLIIAAVCFFALASRIVAQEPNPSLAPSAAPTPHPAKGAMQAALEMYPDLAKPKSAFHLLFRDLYEERKKTAPSSLAQVDWPLELARETAKKLGVKPVPAPEKSAAAGPTPRQNPLLKDSSNPLDKGAYNQHRALYPYGYWIDSSGRRHYYY